MVAIVGDAAIRLRPESSTFATEADAQVSDKLPGVAKKAAGFFVAAFAAVKIGGFLKDAVGQASDLGESASKVGVVFGGMSQQVLDFAHSAASTMGLSNQQALEATGTFGNLAVSLGLTQKQSAGMSMNMVKLAGDLASFNNVDPAQALDALRSGLTGETEPLKQFGINMNQAALKAQAMKLGLDTSGATLSASVQAQAAYSLILAQSTTAQGDFARTSGGLANQQRIIAAQFLDVKANIGGAFLPFVNLAARGVSGLLMPALLTATSYMSDFGTAAGAAMGDVSDYAKAAFGGADASITAFDTSFQRLGFTVGQVAGKAVDEWSTFTDAFRGGGLGILATEPSLAGFLARFGSELRGLSVQAQGTWSTIVTSAGTQLVGLRGTIEPALLPVKAALGNVFSGAGLTGSGTGFVGFLSGVLAQVGPLITGLIDKIGPVLQTIMPLIGSTLAGLVPVVQQVFGAIAPLFGQLGPLIGAVVPVIEQVAGIWRGVFMGALQALLPVLPVIVGGLAQVIGILAGAFMPIVQQLAPIISTLVVVFQGALVGAIKQLVPIIPVLVTALMQVASIVAGALTVALRVLLPIFPVLVQVIGQVVGMIGGALSSVLQALIPILPPIIAALMQVAQALLGALMGALQAILPIIPMLVGVLVTLITQAVLPLLPILPLLANLLSTIISAVAPLIPVIIQVVVLLVQLAVAAIIPLLPIVVVLANLITMLVGVLVPLIQVVVAVAGAFIGFAALVIGSVVKFVSTVIGIYIGLYTGIANIFGSIFGVIRGVWMSIFGFISGIVSSIASTISGVFSGVGRAIGNVFSGIGGAVSSVFTDAVNVVKGVVNSIIGIINTAIGFINHNLIDIANKVPFTSIPHIPPVPKLHSGGVYESGNPSGEGLALLRDAELVATPEQQLIANNLLRDLLGGRLTGDTTTTTTNAGSHITINEHVHAAPGQPVSAIAAQVTQGVVWNLNGGITRPAPSTETAGAHA